MTASTQQIDVESAITARVNNMESNYLSRFGDLSERLAISQAVSQQLETKAINDEFKIEELTKMVIAGSSEQAKLSTLLTAAAETRGNDWKEIATSERAEVKALTTSNDKFKTDLVNRLLVSCLWKIYFMHS